MSVHLEVSLGLWQDRPAPEVIETARIADEVGYDAIWVGEMATWDAFALATHLGTVTDRSRLIVGPLAVTVRDPAMIAMGAASVASLTGRDVGVALGTSSTTVVERWHGRDRRRTGRALDESASAVRVLLDGEKAEVPGEVVRTSGYRLRLPAPRSELIIAAFGPQAIAAAGLRHARNAPYAGAHILDRHGKPAGHIHAIQLEIDRSLYLDPLLDQPGPGFASMVALVRAAIDALADEALDNPHSLAAE